MSVHALKERHANIVLQAQSRLGQLTESGTPIAESDRAAVDEMIAEAAELNAQIETVTRLETLAAEGDADAAVWSEVEARTDGTAVEPRPDHDAQLRQMGLAAVGEAAVPEGGLTLRANLAAARDHRAMIRQGVTADDIVGAHRRGVRLTVDSAAEIRALSVGTDASGGYLVPTLFEASLYDLMAYTGGIRAAGAEVIMTGTGAPLDLPTVSAHATAAGVTAEAADFAETDDTFSEVTLGAYKFTGAAVVSTELLTDNMVDLESYLARSLGRVIANKSERMFTAGTGTNQPKGAFHTPPAAQTHTTAAAAITWPDLTDALFGLDAGYLGPGGGLAWSMHSAVYGEILKIADSDNRPIVLPSVAGPPLRTVHGIPVVFNAHSDSTVAASKFVAAVGNWADAYVIRQVGEVAISASPHPKFVSGQVVFRGELRADGKVRDAKALRYLKIKS